MVNPWCKYKSATKQKKKALHALVAGLVLFSVLYVITRFFPITLCPIQRFLGVSCPGCGMTRAFIAILNGNFYQAIRYNVLSLPIFAGLFIYGVLCISDILLDRNDIQRISAIAKNKFLIILYFIIFALGVFINSLI